MARVVREKGWAQRGKGKGTERRNWERGNTGGKIMGRRGKKGREEKGRGEGKGRRVGGEGEEG